jgi:hypothetical protein
MKKFSLLIAGILLAPFILFAQWSANPAVNNVICNLANDDALPKVAVCTNGDTYIAYFSSAGGNYNVRLQRLDVLGNALWANNGILISNNPSMSWLTDWDISCDPSGYCILAVMDIRNGNNNIYGYRIAPDGTFAWGANGVTLSNNMAFNASPKVTVTSSGNAIVAWAADSVIIMQKISPAGTLLWGSAGITWAPGGASGTHRWDWPQLLPVGSDDFLMKYFEDTGSGLYPTRYVWVQRFGSSGTGVWTLPAPVSTAGGIASFTQILSFINDGSDGCYVAWHDDRDNDQRSNSWVQHISSTGTILLGSNGTEACNNNAYNHFYPEVGFPSGSSDVYVFWNEMNNLQTQWGIFGQKISSAGTLLWGTTGNPFIPLSTTDVYPLSAKPVQSDMVLFYEQYVGASSQLLNAMRITPAMTYVWAGNSAPVSSSVSAKVHEVISDLNYNQWILAWEDNRSGGSDIYAQNLKITGDLGPVGPLTYGNIDGHVTVTGGAANVTSVTVTAGTHTTHPDATGHYAFTNILTGTYTVNATLAGYTSGTHPVVVVLENQTTSNIDFTLAYIPVTGFITGTITLNGGSGNVTQVLVQAGTLSTYPNSSGAYSLEVPGGTYSVIASLMGYSSAGVNGVIVVNGLTTGGVNIALNPMGTLQGHVTLNGGSGNVTQTIVSTGTYSAHPDAGGNYSIDVPAGTYTVTASLSGYESGSQAGVVVTGGQVTSGVNFTLSPIVSAGVILGTVTLEPSGIGDVTQVIVSAGSYLTNPDVNGHYSLSVSAGTYTVQAVLEGFVNFGPEYNNVNIIAGQILSNIDFTLTWSLGIESATEPGPPIVIPNPTGLEGKIQFPVIKSGRYTIELFDPAGRNIANVVRYFNPGTASIPLMNFASVIKSNGLYLLRVSGKESEQVCRFVFTRR